MTVDIYDFDFETGGPGTVMSYGSDAALITGHFGSEEEFRALNKPTEATTNTTFISGVLTAIKQRFGGEL